MVKIDRKERKREMLEAILALYVSQGLENTSVRDTARAVHVNISTLYDYFNSKEDLVIETAKYYLETLTERFSEAREQLAPDLKTELERVFSVLKEERTNLRFIYQVISSPMYGERGRRELEKIYREFLKFSTLLADSYGIVPDRFEEFFLLFVATVHDFCLWDNRELADKKLRCIYHLIDREMEKNQSEA